MSKSFFLFVLSFVFPLLSFANFQCRYAIEAKSDRKVQEVIEEFKEESALEAPKMVKETKCGTPICVGSIACLRNGYPTAVTTAVCKAVQVEGKWTCPSAQNCFNDQDVAHDREPLPASDDLMALGGIDLGSQKTKSPSGADAGGKK